ncbi:hypothetical protein POM88_020541 [Heracleum sosnowskyi]|uniref:Uncharacterized protein n=1 Tax=Heracleum sosnowskyi TaxID=360622 RepID=A0AAD8IC66_9APIA|nr:hypothetical protein POM88_020541 [Heracleum sosnowskyi]
MFENDHSIHYEEEESQKNKEDENEDDDKEENEDDKISDNDDLVCNGSVLIHGRVSRARVRGARRLQSVEGVVKKVLWNLNSPIESHTRGNGAAVVKVVTKKNHLSMRDQQCILLNRNQPDAKHTLQHIVRIRWDENTINTNGSNREAFYDGCIEKFQDINVEREAKGEMPILDDEFMGLVYGPSELVVIELQEKVRKVRSELTLEDESTDEPPSPCTQKELHRKKDLIATMQARPPNRKMILLHPQSTVGELLGAREAAQWVSSKEKTSVHDNAITDEIYSRMLTILDEVRQMVCSFPMREVKKSDLDERVRNLAAAALPDRNQHALQSHYVRAATGLLRQIFFSLFYFMKQI